MAERLVRPINPEVLDGIVKGAPIDPEVARYEFPLTGRRHAEFFGNSGHSSIGDLALPLNAGIPGDAELVAIAKEEQRLIRGLLGPYARLLDQRPCDLMDTPEEERNGYTLEADYETGRFVLAIDTIIPGISYHFEAEPQRHVRVAQYVPAEEIRQYLAIAEPAIAPSN